MRCLYPCFLWSCFLAVSATAQTDNFDDNNDNGWTRLDLIGSALGSPLAEFKVQSGRYHLSCPGSPDPDQAGPARAGTYRPDAVYTDFRVVVDVASWDDSLDQAFGILARIQEGPGPGNLGAYSVNYQPQDHDLEINRIDSEQPSNLARMSIFLEPGETYRFVFIGKAGLLTAAVYARSEPLLPLIVLSAEDSTYESGNCGLFIFNAAGTGPADATFDSYEASVPTSPELTLGEDAAVAGAVITTWPRAASDWHLEFSADLNSWEEVTKGGNLSGDGLQLTFSAPAKGTGFFRLREGFASQDAVGQ